MSYPQHPETIILKNQYYPQGLTELSIWNYYQSVKPELLNETRNRDVMLAIMVDLNKPILRRKGKDEKYIRLLPKNYDEIITGRTITVYSEMTMYETKGIIDIDIDDFDGFSWAKKTTLDVYDFVMDKMPLVKTASIRFTGKSSFHVICDFGKKMKVDTIRFLLRQFLQNSPLSKVYTIEAKRRPGIPNLDLSPNKLRGAFITLNSLSIIGLKCMEIPYNKVNTFEPRMARIS